MLGLTSSVAKSVQNELMTGREWQHALYVRDNWTISPKFTVNIGCAVGVLPHHDAG